MSKAFSISKDDLKKIAIGAGVAVTGALLTYLSETASTLDFGSWTPLVTAGFAVLVNVFRKWSMPQL